MCPPQNYDQEASLYIQDASEWVPGGLLQQDSMTKDFGFIVVWDEQRSVRAK